MQFFSLGIPAHNEEASIARMLARVFKSIAWKNHQGRREVIVCANGCSDKTPEVVRTLQQVHPEIKLIEISKKSKNAAWEALVHASNSKAENVFFADADVLIFPKSFDALERALEKNPSVVIASGTLVPSAGYTGKRAMYEDDYVQFHRLMRGKSAHGFCSALYAMRRPVALQTRMPAQPQIGDALYLTFKYSTQMVHVPEARVVYRIPHKHERHFGRIRSTVSRKLLRELPEFRAFELQQKTFEHSMGRLGKIVYLTRKLGFLRALRIYLQHVRKPSSIHKTASAHVQAKTDSWAQMPSTKLVSKRKKRF